MDIVSDVRREIVDGALRLPRLPVGAMEIRRVLQDEEASMAQVVQAVGRDVSIAARVMMVANSAWYWSDTKIATLQAAVTRIGLSTVGNVVLGFAVKDAFRSKNVDCDAYLRATWEDSVRTACCAAELAKTTRHLDKDTAFLAGLMSSIGALPIIAYCERHALPWEQAKAALWNSHALNGLVLTSLGMPSDVVRGADVGDGEVDPVRVEYLDTTLAGMALPMLTEATSARHPSARKLIRTQAELEDVRAKSTHLWQELKPAFDR